MSLPSILAIAYTPSKVKSCKRARPRKRRECWLEQRESSERGERAVPERFRWVRGQRGAERCFARRQWESVRWLLQRERWVKEGQEVRIRGRIGSFKDL